MTPRLFEPPGITFPNRNAVVVIKSKTNDMKAEIDLVWSRLLPAFGAGALDENPEDLVRLKAAENGVTD